jgi:hypothetical protein
MNGDHREVSQDERSGGDQNEVAGSPDGTGVKLAMRQNCRALVRKLGSLTAPGLQERRGEMERREGAICWHGAVSKGTENEWGLRRRRGSCAQSRARMIRTTVEDANVD